MILDIDSRASEGQHLSFGKNYGVPPGELHLWTATDAISSVPNQHEDHSLLSAYEREAARGFAPVRRQQFISGRVLTRLALSWHCPVRPWEWAFAPGAYGRPSVVAPEKYRDLQFSISHTDGLTACLVSMIEQAAVDVEKVSEWEDLPQAAPQVLSARELSDLASFSGSAWYARFFDYWTLKEAYAKACGIGLGLDLTKVGFYLGAGTEVRAWFAAGSDDHPARWTFQRLRLRPNYAAAVAIRRTRKEGCTLIHRHARIIRAGETAALLKDEQRCAPR